jgi:hypothetical protein
MPPDCCFCSCGYCFVLPQKAAADVPDVMSVDASGNATFTADPERFPQVGRWVVDPTRQLYPLWFCGSAGRLAKYLLPLISG